MLCVERDLFLYRSYLCQRKFGVVRDEIHPSTGHEALKPLRKLADYLQVSACFFIRSLNTYM